MRLPWTGMKGSGGDGIPVELFQILKGDAVKVLHSICQQFGKLRIATGLGKGQFLFQSQRKTMPKNVQTMEEVHSSHTVAKQCSKFSKPCFNSTLTMNSQMFKQNVENGEKMRSNCQHMLDH